MNWKTRDGREIAIKDLDDDHLIKNLHRESGKAEAHQRKYQKALKEFERAKKELKKQSDLLNFHEEMRDVLYEEVKYRHLIMRYFLDFKPENVRVGKSEGENLIKKDKKDDENSREEVKEESLRKAE